MSSMRWKKLGKIFDPFVQINQSTYSNSGLGIGLALTMVSAGVIAALSIRHIEKRWSGFSRFARNAPYASVVLILMVGLYTGWMGWSSI